MTENNLTQLGSLMSCGQQPVLALPSINNLLSQIFYELKERKINNN